MNAPDTFELAYNDIWDNEPENVCRGGVPGESPCEAIEYANIDGNLDKDPRFADEGEYVLSARSALVDSGDPALFDVDGTRSDIGLHGGPEAGRTTLPE